MGEEGQTFTDRLIIHLAKILILRIALATVRGTASGPPFLSLGLGLLRQLVGYCQGSASLPSGGVAVRYFGKRPPSGGGSTV